VGLVALAQAERAGEVAGQHIYLLDVGNQSLVDGLLIRRSAAANLLLLLKYHFRQLLSPARSQCPTNSYLWLLSLLEESLLAGLVLGYVTGEV
jgi:hypothetical protein